MPRPFPALSPALRYWVFTLLVGWGILFGTYALVTGMLFFAGALH